MEQSRLDFAYRLVGSALLRPAYKNTTLSPRVASYFDRKILLI